MSKDDSHVAKSQSRREFIRKALYSSPVLLTLPATPSFAQQGSGGGGSTGGGGDPMGGTCPPGLVDLCDIQVQSDPQGRTFCEIPIEEGGLDPAGRPYCAS